MADSADNATQTVRLLYRQINADRQHLLAQQGATVTAIQLIQHLPEHPVITMPLVTRLLETSNLTAGKAIELLVAAGDLASQTVAHLKDYLNKDAAENWCKNATSYSLKHGGKPWIYRLISHDTISENMSVDHLGKG